ncbi:MAG: hypothetical protein OQK76_07540 [Gammaproteobacteria bacterium]|nr:hypothetical protein [Gammaproteobacteria bacterium]
MAVLRFSASILLIMVFFSLSLSAQAANPFKKSIDYDFSDNTAWTLKRDTAVTRGEIKEGSDSLFFHLSINNQQLKLRFSKNDPAGQVINSRSVSSLVIEDVRVNGTRLPLFQWCLNNQQAESSAFKQGTPVSKNACINEDGDFIIKLDNKSRQLLKSAQTLEFVTEPYRRTENLKFAMAGYVAIMKKLEKPAPVKQVKVIPKPVVKPVVAAKKVVKTCYAKPPVGYKSIKSVAYPCPDAAKKTEAEAKINQQVVAEKKKADLLAAEARKKQEPKVDTAAEAKAEEEWQKRQTAIWIKRCEKHWMKSVSPCYCKPYIAHAPKGVQDTCPAN